MVQLCSYADQLKKSKTTCSCKPNLQRRKEFVSLVYMGQLMLYDCRKQTKSWIYKAAVQSKIITFELSIM